MRETARDHTPMTALPYYRVAARAVPAITATPCGGYPPEKRQTDTLRSGVHTAFFEYDDRYAGKINVTPARGLCANSRLIPCRNEFNALS